MLKRKQRKQIALVLSHFHLQLLISSLALKLLTSERQQTILSRSPPTELQFSLPPPSPFLLFRAPFFLWWATEPFPWQCMHQQTCWYDLKGHVLFTLTEAFQNSDEGVPLKDSADALQQQPQQHWLMFYIKSPFPIQPAFLEEVMLNQNGPSAPTLVPPDLIHWDVKG